MKKSPIIKKCVQCSKEFRVSPSETKIKHCSKYCAGISRRKPVVDERDMHESYDKQYSLAVKKRKLLELQRQNYLNELLLEQLPSTPDLTMRLQMIDENGRLLK